MYLELSNERPNYEEILAKIKNGEIKAISNEEIRRKRQNLNKKLIFIHELIKEGRLSDAEKEANDIIKTKKCFKSFKSDG